MKTILRLMLISTVLWQISCNKEYDDLYSMLNGVWVHAETMTDTIDFNLNNYVSEKEFELKRGKEIHNDEELPKIGSGPYVYEIKPDSIHLRHVLSGSGEPLSYYFRIYRDGKSFVIGSFAPFVEGVTVNKFIKID